MGILQTDKTLPVNRLIFDVRRDPALFARFRADLDGIMSEYGLSAAEQVALRSIDLKALAALGVHPYFLPQVARLFKGGGYNHNESAAAQLYANKMLASGD
jgi:Aromatic-ring-opening dioxygenase LigAB, LigA subunit